MLEVEGPTSADAGVTSCLLFDAEPVFRRLRDDLLADICLDGMFGRLKQVKYDGPGSGSRKNGSLMQGS